MNEGIGIALISSILLTAIIALGVACAHLVRALLTAWGA